MSKPLSVAILGATGYTGLELIRLLMRHPKVQIAKLCGRQDAGQPISTVFPALKGILDMRIESPETADLSDCPIIFSALPHTASMGAIASLVSKERLIIDLSADYRLPDATLYETWYQHPHTDPGHLKEAVYGLPEWFAKEIKGAHLIANPGCYPTASTLAIAPLLSKGLIRPNSILIDAKSGVSGAGKKLSQTTQYCEANESISAYKIGQHQHSPEIEMVLSRIAGKGADILFTPHLVPMDRGILVTCYAELLDPTLDERLIQDAYETAYASCPMTQVVSVPPKTKDVAWTSQAHVFVKKVGRRVVAVGVIDNLLKGASGQAVQNLNIAKGWDETLGLI